MPARGDNGIYLRMRTQLCQWASAGSATGPEQAEESVMPQIETGSWHFVPSVKPRAGQQVILPSS